MARTVITPTNLPGSSYGVGFQEFVWTAADVANGNAFASTGKEILLARNTNGAATDRKVTLYKSYGKIEYTLGAGLYLCTGQIPTTGWKQSSDSNVWVDGDNAEVEFAVVVLP